MGGNNSVSATNVPLLELPPISASVRSQTFPAASTTTLAAVLAPCAAFTVGKFSKRQTRGPGGNDENFFCRRIAQSAVDGRFPGVGDSMQATAPCSGISEGFT